MTGAGKRFKRRLRKLGLSDPAIDAAWPAWWSDAAEASPSALAELRFSLSRKLGLDPRSLLHDDDEPTFVWTHDARFKRLASETATETAAIASFGISVSRILLSATPAGPSLGAVTAKGLRATILSKQRFVRLLDLLALCWSVGIPVAHLRVFPLPAKRMYAMTTCLGGRHAILLAKDANYPAWCAFYLAHELAHVMLGHLGSNAALVDLDMPSDPQNDDEQEVAADRFALELLTGEPEPIVVGEATQYPSAAGLARAVLDASDDLRAEPGTLALCFGKSTGNWAAANSALEHVYDAPNPVWAEVNRVAWSQLEIAQVSPDLVSFLTAVVSKS